MALNKFTEVFDLSANFSFYEIPAPSPYLPASVLALDTQTPKSYVLYYKYLVWVVKAMFLLSVGGTIELFGSVNFNCV